MLARPSSKINPQPGGSRWAGKITLEELRLAADHPRGKVLAEASVIVGGAVALRHLRILPGRLGTVWLAMPAKKADPDEDWLKTIELLDAHLAAEVHRIVIEEYASVLAAQAGGAAALWSAGEPTDKDGDPC